MMNPATNVRDAWRQLTLEPLSRADDPRYVDCSDARGVDVARKLHDSLRLHSADKICMHLLFTGYRGDGKTTELYRFADLIKDTYRPLYFNAQEEFDLNDFRFPDFLLGISTAIFRRMSEENLILPDALLGEVADWFSTIVETVERKTTAELKAEAGVGIPAWFSYVTGRLVGTIKTGGERRREVRRELDQRLPHLIDKVDKLLSRAVKASEDLDGKELVIIFDNLDRLQPEPAYDFFHTNGRNLRQLNCHFVYVVPISLLYHPESPLLPFEHDNVIIMPMIPIRSKNGEYNEVGIAHLRGLLERRFIPNEIITNCDAITRDMILSSGGNLRDLMRLFRQACRDALSHPDETIDQHVARRAINALCETYQRSAVEDDYAHLAHTFRTKEAENNERTQRLIFHLLILVYDENGVTWKDVHPALAGGERFQRLVAGDGPA